MDCVSRFQSSSDIFSLQQQLILGNEVIIFVFIITNIFLKNNAAIVLAYA